MDCLKRALEKCVLCPRGCKVNRFRGDVGYCGIGNEILVSHYGPHFGEDRQSQEYMAQGTYFSHPVTFDVSIARIFRSVISVPEKALRSMNL